MCKIPKLKENETAAKQNGFNCCRKISDLSFVADIRSRPELYASERSEDMCLGNNWIAMDSVTSKQISLPNYTFPILLGLTPRPVASPEDPFPLPNNKRPSPFRHGITVYSQERGGSSATLITKQAMVFDLLSCVCANTEGLLPMTSLSRVLHGRFNSDIDLSQRFLNNTTKPLNELGIPKRTPSAYQLFSSKERQTQAASSGKKVTVSQSGKVFQVLG